MREQVYRVMAVVAWPALAWCAFEVALRLAVGAHDGLPMAALLGACAGGTVLAANWRRRQLAPMTVPARDR